MSVGLHLQDAILQHGARAEIGQRESDETGLRAPFHAGQGVQGCEIIKDVKQVEVY